jgi:hypothetical protein
MSISQNGVIELKLKTAFIMAPAPKGTMRPEPVEPNAFPASELYNDNLFVKEILRTGREIA